MDFFSPQSIPLYLILKLRLATYIFNLPRIYAVDMWKKGLVYQNTTIKWQKRSIKYVYVDSFAMFPCLLCTFSFSFCVFYFVLQRNTKSRSYGRNKYRIATSTHKSINTLKRKERERKINKTCWINCELVFHITKKCKKLVYFLVFFTQFQYTRTGIERT